MTDYTELVKALRGKFIAYDVTGNHNSAQLYKDAAAAIEELDAEETRLLLISSELQDKVVELEQQLPKRGEWVDDTTTYAGPGLSNYKCSLCGKICGTWRRGLKPSELPNWCGNCGADMRAKMEVQE